jgi:cystathionine beta-synthase
LGKIFDDDWMREHGFLDPDEGFGSIRELLAGKPAMVHTVQKSDKVRHVIGLMKERGISQVPVVDEGRLVGIVTESHVLQSLLEGGLERLDDVCAGVMTDQYEVADPDAPVGLFHHVFAQGKVIVVWERGQVRGLVTKIDVIDYLAHKRRVS